MPVFTRTAPTQKRGSNIITSFHEVSRGRIRYGIPALCPQSAMSIARKGERGLLSISGTSRYYTHTETRTNGAGRKPLNGIFPAFGGYECQR